MINKITNSIRKYALTLPIFAMFLTSVQARSTVNNPELLKDTTVNTAQTDKPLVGVEKMPQFPGGDKALMDFFSRNLRYPASAVEKKIQGRVTLRFVVNKTGNIENIEVIRGLNEACDAEAVRVIKLMPKWIPGVQKGKNVSVYFTIPILFKLPAASTSSNIQSEKMPLVYVDGIEKSISYLKDTTLFKQADIANSVFIKDSAAIKTYGEKGKNGVLLIITKGKNGATDKK
jgi:TonB family protein